MWGKGKMAVNSDAPLTVDSLPDQARRGKAQHSGLTKAVFLSSHNANLKCILGHPKLFLFSLAFRSQVSDYQFFRKISKKVVPAKNKMR